MLNSGLTENQWPVRLKPQEDELLSSWLMRLAMVHGLKLHTFCSITFPNKAIWNRDIDKSADDKIKQILSDKTGVSIERVYATTLAAYESVIYEKHNHFGPSPWIMPVGIYHRRRRKFGLQYCPRCLAEDKEPYYRRKWRIAFIVLCERHSIQLHDRCPSCEEPINFHRNELGNYRKFVADSLTLCHTCHFNLRMTEDKQIIPITDVEAKFTNMLLGAMDTGFFQLSEGVITYSHLFFSGLRQLMKILAMQDRRVANMRQSISETFKVKIYVPSTLGATDVQELGIEARRQLLRLAYCLLQEWPHYFVELSRKYRLWSSVWMRHLEPTSQRATAPFWFWRVIHDYLYRAKYCPSDNEIASAIRYLMSTGKTVNLSTIARTLGVAVIRNRVKVR